jgi:hypothetical protein
LKATAAELDTAKKTIESEGKESSDLKKQLAEATSKAATVAEELKNAQAVSRGPIAFSYHHALTSRF